jgi:hypothetical protein
MEKFCMLPCPYCDSCCQLLWLHIPMVVEHVCARRHRYTNDDVLKSV